MLLSWCIQVTIILGASGTFVHGDEPWSWTNTKEASCHSCTCASRETMQGLDALRALRLLASGKFNYNVMMSQLNVNRISLLTLGQHITADAQLQALCFPSFPWIGIGSNKFSTQWGTLDNINTGHCEIEINAGKINCRNVRTLKLVNETGITSTNPKRGGALLQNMMTNDLDLRIVWTNYKSAVLFTKCLGQKGYSTWFVVSSSKTIHKKTKRKVMGMIKRLGFNPKMHENCREQNANDVYFPYCLLFFQLNKATLSSIEGSFPPVFPYFCVTPFRT